MCIMLLVVALLLGTMASTVNCYPLPRDNTASIMAAQQQLSSILQQAANNLLNKVESRPSLQPSLKLHVRLAQPPQNYYNAHSRQSPSWKPTAARPPPLSLPNVHVHPIKPVQPVPPVQEMPAGVHIILCPSQ